MVAIKHNLDKKSFKYDYPELLLQAVAVLSVPDIRLQGRLT